MPLEPAFPTYPLEPKITETPMKLIFERLSGKRAIAIFG